MTGIEIPPLVRQRGRSKGTLGAQWLQALPAVVAGLSAQWGLQLGRAYRGGTAGYVAAACDPSGQEVVLKVAMALDDEDVAKYRRSVVVHRLAGGQGCARLLAHDDAVSALLLERLGPSLHEMDTPLPRLLETVATTLRSLWRPVDEDVDLPTGADEAVSLATTIVTTWEQLHRPCPLDVVDRAVGYCDERAAAFDPTAAVLVHGDAHGWNTLDAGAGRCKLVDPEGARSEPARDLGVPMREYNGPLLAGDTSRLVRERAELLAEWCGVDPVAVWQWGYVERVATGLLNLRDFDDDHDATAFLEVAARSR
jgi:streptomycin 6-kinase